MINLDKDNFEALTEYVLKATGMQLDNSKICLMEARLNPLLDELECKSFNEFYERLESDSMGTLGKKVIDAITTNETFFFRDAAPFEVLQHKILPDVIDRKTAQYADTKIPIRIWSAACSTGQEAYSIAMVVNELLVDMNKYSISILGTDISDEALAKAASGNYSKFEIERGLSSDKLQKYFGCDGQRWQVKDKLRSIVSFKKFNLMDSLESLEKFDIIFCRNVAIYFTEKDKIALYDKIANALEPDGCLIIGASELMEGACERFEPQKHLGTIIYKLKQQEVEVRC